MACYNLGNNGDKTTAHRHMWLPGSPAVASEPLFKLAVPPGTALAADVSSTKFECDHRTGLAP
eukprot:scaffold2828_cov37-Prasinocladus_malaysianus.AAC.1